MKFSSRIEECSLSPIRKFGPYLVEAQAKGRTVYQLNIGQPDVETPPAFFEAVGNFGEKVLAYAPSPGVVTYLEAVRDYYVGMGYPVTCDEILAHYYPGTTLETLG